MLNYAMAMHPGGPHYWGWGGGPFGFLFNILVILAIVWLGMKVYHSFKNERSRPAPLPKGDPLQILKERYAKGEISEDEFKQMRDTLKS